MTFDLMISLFRLQWVETYEYTHDFSHFLIVSLVEFSDARLLFRYIHTFLYVWPYHANTVDPDLCACLDLNYSFCLQRRSRNPPFERLWIFESFNGQIELKLKHRDSFWNWNCYSGFNRYFNIFHPYFFWASFEVRP